MPRDARFWRNVTIIALLHVALLVAFIRWSRQPKKQITSDVVWMNGGAGETGDTTASTSAAPPPAPAQREEASTPTPEIKPEPTKTEEAEEEQPVRHGGEERHPTSDCDTKPNFNTNAHT